MPRFINVNPALAQRVEDLLAKNYRLFHNTEIHFRDLPLSEQELAELETYSRYADSAGGPPPGVHSERWIK